MANYKAREFTAGELTGALMSRNEVEPAPEAVVRLIESDPGVSYVSLAIIMARFVALRARVEESRANGQNPYCCESDQMFFCTLPKGHAGPHEAHGEQKVEHRWNA